MRFYTILEKLKYLYEKYKNTEILETFTLGNQIEFMLTKLMIEIHHWLEFERKEYKNEKE